MIDESFLPRTATASAPVSTYSSPLEDFFDVERNSTPTPVQFTLPPVLMADTNADTMGGLDVVEIDDKRTDEQVSAELDTVYVAAMQAFETQTTAMVSDDPKFSARHGEVAAQFLKIALETTKARAGNNLANKKLRGAAKQPAAAPSTVTNNNLIIRGNREEILDKIASGELDITDLEGVIDA